jgi:hypothetical protein
VFVSSWLVIVVLFACNGVLPKEEDGGHGFAAAEGGYGRPLKGCLDMSPGLELVGDARGAPTRWRTPLSDASCMTTSCSIE